jgi:hypothetical protein
MLEEAKEIKIIEEKKFWLIAHVPAPLAIGTANKRNNLLWNGFHFYYNYRIFFC